jgi:hypothetical protein
MYSGLDFAFWGQMCISGPKCVFRAFFISGLFLFRAARLKHGTFSEIWAGPWAEGSARGPARHGPNLILGRAGPKLNVLGLFGLGPGRAGRPECTPILESTFPDALTEGTETSFSQAINPGALPLNGELPETVICSACRRNAAATRLHLRPLRPVLTAFSPLSCASAAAVEPGGNPPPQASHRAELRDGCGARPTTQPQRQQPLYKAIPHLPVPRPRSLRFPPNPLQTRARSRRETTQDFLTLPLLPAQFLRQRLCLFQWTATTLPACSWAHPPLHSASPRWTPGSSTRYAAAAAGASSGCPRRQGVAAGLRRGRRCPTQRGRALGTTAMPGNARRRPRGPPVARRPA